MQNSESSGKMTNSNNNSSIDASQCRQGEFNLKTKDDLQVLANELGVAIGAQEDLSPLARPVQVGNYLIPNSLAIHPMEGCDGDSQGRPDELTIRRYDRFAAGGAGLLWVEAMAVVPEARANPRQLWIHSGSQKAFTDLVKRIRLMAAKHCGSGHRPLLILQLTHSGRYSKPVSQPEPMICQHDPYRDGLVPQPKPNKDVPTKIPAEQPVVTDEYLDKLQDAYVQSARMAFAAGFDGVDIKSCHGYLVNELLGSHERAGKYGGSFENRSRFLLEVMHKIQSEWGKEKLITTRMGVYDAVPYPYGWGVDRDDYTKCDLTEPVKLISLLVQRGLKLLNITIANPYYNPHCNRPFSRPIEGGYEQPEHPLLGVVRLIDLAAQIQKQFPRLAVVGTGYSWLRGLFGQVAAASKAHKKATLIGGGRMAFAYPDFPHDIIETGKLDLRKVCICCSMCSQIMRNGGRTGCVIRDNKVYGPIFRQGSTDSNGRRG